MSRCRSRAAPSAEDPSRTWSAVDMKHRVGVTHRQVTAIRGSRKREPPRLHRVRWFLHPELGRPRRQLSAPPRPARPDAQVKPDVQLDGLVDLRHSPARGGGTDPGWVTDHPPAFGPPDSPPHRP